MSRETMTLKAARLLLSGAVNVTTVRVARPERGAGAYVFGTCRGDSDSWAFGYRDGAWWCACPAFTHRATCSHLLAARRVVTVDLEGDQ